jgi:hypothetical protein
VAQIEALVEEAVKIIINTFRSPKPTVLSFRLQEKNDDC